MSDMNILCPANWSKLLKKYKNQEERINKLQNTILYKESVKINRDGYITLQIGRVLISCPQDTPEYLALSREFIELMMQSSNKSSDKDE